MTLKRFLPFEKKDTWAGILYGFLLVGVFAYLASLGPMTAPDTASYTGLATYRSPLYPLILRINTFFFGAENYGVLYLLQILFGLSGVHFLIKTLKGLFQFEGWVTLPLLLVFGIPLYGMVYFGNRILTEAICYPLFLMAFGTLLTGLLRQKTTSLLWFLLWTACLVLTRRQFLFLYPVFFAALGYIVLLAPRSYKKLLLTFAFLGTFMFTELTERGAQYLKDGHFTTIPFTGIQLVVAPLYLSNQEDVALFKDDPLKAAIFRDVWELMSEEKACQRSINQDDVSSSIFYYYHYNHNYNKIHWPLLHKALAKNNVTDVYDHDRITTEMALTLIKSNPVSFAKFYLVGIALSLGGYLFTALVALILISSFFLSLLYRNKYAVSLFFITLMTFGNYMLVCLVEPALVRYTLYTDTILVSLFFIGLCEAMRSLKLES